MHLFHNFTFWHRNIQIFFVCFCGDFFVLQHQFFSHWLFCPAAPIFHGQLKGDPFHLVHFGWSGKRTLAERGGHPFKLTV